MNNTHTENSLLRLLQVQSNLTPNDFADLFGEDRGRYLFSIFARESWNLLSFLFNKINGNDREKLLKMINQRINE